MGPGTHVPCRRCRQPPTDTLRTWYEIGRVVGWGGGLVTRKRSGWVLRAREDPTRISYLELFFDLGLVVALSRLSQRLTTDLSWFNALETVILLAAVWWVWTVTAYTTDWYDPGQPLVQLIVLGVMFGGLLMSAAVFGAFEDSEGLAFAGAYVGLHLGRGLVLVTALRGRALRLRSLRVAIWFAITGVLWLGGAFLPGPARLALWAVAITLDYLVGLFGYALPRLGRTSTEELRVVGEHLSERYRQMFIVTLGEILLMGAINYGRADFGSARMAGLILLFVNAVALWRIYIVYVAERLAIGIDQSSNPGRVALVAAYAHLIMVAGVVLIAASGDLIITEPTGGTSHAWLAVLVAGPVVFLIGRAVYALQVFRSMLWRLPIGALVLVAAAPLLAQLPPLGVATAMNAALLAIAYIPHAGASRYLSSRNVRTRW
ncbi:MULTISPECIES: low temperature requirement protein A [Micromonospora]|uniref:low temperature requirement protein A n=1 Tax=Micromonospora TaxID=1873 RepID=UPI00137499BA|nr:MULTISPECIES: low temperature requirement protein A [unclassified Micromonospora]MBM0225905.1 low temperature requirement protein A [Micromonospora sp. ATA51]